MAWASLMRLGWCRCRDAAQKRIIVYQNVSVSYRRDNRGIASAKHATSIVGSLIPMSSIPFPGQRRPFDMPAGQIIWGSAVERHNVVLITHLLQSMSQKKRIPPDGPLVRQQLDPRARMAESSIAVVVS